MCKILVIEDDFYLRSNICDILTNENYEVECADNGVTGIIQARSTYPDLIISDIMMPEMNGFDLLETLMKDPETAGIPFIFLTAKAEPENLRRGMKLGADDYLFKPFNLDDLLEAVKIRIKKKNLSDLKIKMMQEQISQKIPHELRTPLVPILGYAEMMQEEDDLSQIREMAKVIRKSGKILHGKIEKFLLYKELVIKENKKTLTVDDNKSSVISNTLISHCITKLPKELLPERIKVNIETCCLPIPELDLGTILIELLENGLKYSNDEEVILTGLKESENYKITVSDAGRGMKDDEIKDITAFRKFGEHKFAENGLGLGLSIVRKIVELNKCNFNIRSELNKFTLCEIIIPLKSTEDKT